jgi:hypothetical protein
MDVHELEVITVVDQADHFEPERGCTLDFADKHISGLPGSD